MNSKIIVFIIFILRQSVLIKNINFPENYFQEASQENTCTEGEEIVDFILPKRNAKIRHLNEDDQSNPETAIIELLVIVDKALYDSVGGQYIKGIWMKPGTISNATPETEKQEVITYIRKFVSALNFRFQNQFTNPNIILHITGMMIGEPTKFIKKTFGFLDAFATADLMGYEICTKRKSLQFDVAMLLTNS